VDPIHLIYSGTQQEEELDAAAARPPSRRAGSRKNLFVPRSRLVVALLAIVLACGASTAAPSSPREAPMPDGGSPARPPGARVGGACVADEIACAAIGSDKLRCQDGRFVVASTCRGPNGCQRVGDAPRCDTDVADDADPCDAVNELACALDGRALYRCDGAKRIVESTCKGPEGCRVDGNVVKCDHHLAVVGDACHIDGNYACSTDFTMVLRCKDKRFVRAKQCKEPCAMRPVGEDSTEFVCK